MPVVGGKNYEEHGNLFLVVGVCSLVGALYLLSDTMGTIQGAATSLNIHNNAAATLWATGSVWFGPWWALVSLGWSWSNRHLPIAKPVGGVASANLVAILLIVWLRSTLP